MARKIAVNLAHVGSYQRDESQPNLYVLESMAKALGVSLDYLVFDEKDGVAAARIRDKQLLEQFEILMRLNDEDDPQCHRRIGG